MTAAKREPRIVTIADIEIYFRLADANYWFGNTWCPAVSERKEGGYAIRVRTPQRRPGQDNFDYFYLDADGLITTAPRGFARDFKPGRIPDIASIAAQFATPDPAARRIA